MGAAVCLLQPVPPPVAAETTAPTPPLLAPPEAPAWYPELPPFSLPAWASLEASYVSQPMVNIRGGAARAASYADQWQLNLTLGRDLQKKEAERTEADRWTLHGNLSLQLGAPAFASRIATAFSPQSVYYPQGFWLRGLYLQRQGQGLKIQLGPGLTMNSLLDAPAYGFYVNSMINDTLNLQVPGLPIDPYNSLGGLLEWRLSPNFQARVGLFRLVGDRTPQSLSAANSRGWNLAADQDGLVNALRLDYRFLPDQEALPVCLDARRPGRYGRFRASCPTRGAIASSLPPPLLQLGGYAVNGSLPFLDGSGRTGSGTRGVFLHGTTPLALPLGHGSRLWATAVWNSNGTVNPVSQQWMGGLISQGVLPSRPFDHWILGVSHSRFSPDSTSAAPVAGAPQTATTTVELGYLSQINQRFSVQPGLQIWFNPSGDGQGRTAIIPFLQFALSL